jgi:hypothetical protein
MHTIARTVMVTVTAKAKAKAIKRVSAVCYIL